MAVLDELCKLANWVGPAVGAGVAEEAGAGDWPVLKSKPNGGPNLGRPLTVARKAARLSNSFGN